MPKTLILICMAIAALGAFAIPAAATASPRLCETAAGGGEPCTNLVTGVKVRDHNVGNWTIATTLGNLICTSSQTTGTLTKNTGTHIEIDIESVSVSGTGVGGDCTSPIGDFKVTTSVGNGVPWCLTLGGELAADKFTIRGNSCTGASRSLTFVFDFTEGPTCYYNREPKVEGTFTTDTATGEDAVLTFSEQEWKLEKGENETFLKPCPGSFKLAQSFTLETDVEGTSPLYIK